MSPHPQQAHSSSYTALQRSIQSDLGYTTSHCPTIQRLNRENKYRLPKPLDSAATETHTSFGKEPRGEYRDLGSNLVSCVHCYGILSNNFSAAYLQNGVNSNLIGMLGGVTKIACATCVVHIEQDIGFLGVCMCVFNPWSLPSLT